MRKGTKKKRIFFWTATAILTAVALFALGMFLRSELTNARSESDFKELSRLVIRNSPTPVTPSPVPTVVQIQIPSEPGVTLPTPTSTLVPTATPTLAPLADYEALYALNPDFFGWITVEGTRVDYPVMYSPDRPLQYLGHDFEGNFSYAGVPYLAPDCDPEGDYYLVYGHHMKNGTMFAGLMAYEDESFWKEHPTFRFDTRFERRTYAVVAAFRARVLQKDENGFRYYSYSALEDEETFRAFMTNVRAMAAYDTAVETTFGDEILTLSTCAYHTEKGRFVVVAKRVE